MFAFPFCLAAARKLLRTLVLPRCLRALVLTKVVLRTQRKLLEKEARRRAEAGEVSPAAEETS